MRGVRRNRAQATWPASQAARLKEAAKLGFSRGLVPAGTKGEGIALERISDVGALVRALAAT
jgi:predicted ATP-dependent serine protease